jgi:F-type H+-transporting ATPase subunit epsilon
MATPGIPQHLRLEFVTPERAIVHEDVDEVGIPGEDGHFGVLPGHAPLLATLAAGEMWYRVKGEIKYIFVAGGFVEVVPDRVSVLAQVAERAEEIDTQRAEASKRRATERLTKAAADVDFERARIAMLRAIARMQVAERTKRPRH